MSVSAVRKIKDRAAYDKLYPKCAVELSAGVELLQFAYNVHGCFKTPLDVIGHHVGIQHIILLPCRGQIRKACKVVQQEWAVDKNLGVPAGQVQDVTLAEEDGLEEGRVDAVRVDQIPKGTSPDIKYL